MDSLWSSDSLIRVQLKSGASLVGIVWAICTHSSYKRTSERESWFPSFSLYSGRALCILSPQDSLDGEFPKCRKGFKCWAASKLHKGAVLLWPQVTLISTCFIFIIALFTAGYSLILLFIVYLLCQNVSTMKVRNLFSLSSFVHCFIPWAWNSTWHIVEASCSHLFEWISKYKVLSTIPST